MFIKKPNENFRIAFRSKHTGLDDFTIICEKMSDISTVTLTTTVTEIQRDGSDTGDYYIDGLVFANTGDYLLTIIDNTNNKTLKAMIGIREETATSTDSGESFGVIY